jgi:hypothetical protein
MDVLPVRYELDFEDLKATEGYSQPHDFLIPFDWDLQLQEESDRQLQLEEESLVERERQGRQQLESM